LILVVAAVRDLTLKVVCPFDVKSVEEYLILMYCQIIEKLKKIGIFQEYGVTANYLDYRIQHLK
jgi:hypothetical protein